MIDTHAHLDFKNYDEDREGVIQRAFNNGVKKIVNIGVDIKTSKKSIALAEKHEHIFAAVGLHPDFFSKAEKEFPISKFQFPNKSQISNPKYENIFEELKSIAKNNKVVAIGEIGLDYYHITPAEGEARQGRHSMGHITKEKLEEIKNNQKGGFLAQIDLAKEFGLPVIVHCRNSAERAEKADVADTESAWEDLYEIISGVYKSSTLSSPDYSSGNSPELSFMKFVLHCYSGNKADTEKFLELANVHFSFSGNITYPKPAGRAEKLAEAVKMIPLDRIMLDSDSPFLAPQEFRGKRNEPAFIGNIADKIADIKDLSVYEIEKITDENAEKFFRLG